MDMSPPWKSVALATCMLAAITLPSNAADNEIKNGEFNQGLLNWDERCIESGTRKNSNRKAFAVVADGTEGPDLKVLEITLDPKEACVLSQKFRVSTKVDYLTVSFRYKASSDFQLRTMGPLAVGIEGTIDRVPIRPNLVPGGGWEVFSNRYVVRANRPPTSLWINLLPCVGKVFIDDIKITAESR